MKTDEPNLHSPAAEPEGAQQPTPEAESQSFAETALKLGGKSEEEARRARGDRQGRRPGRGAVRPQYQTSTAPRIGAVWDGQVPVELFVSERARHSAGRGESDGRFAGRRAAARRESASILDEHRKVSARDVLDELAAAGYWGLLVDQEYGGSGAPFARFRPLPDPDGHDRSHRRRPGFGARLHRRGRSGADVRQRRAKATLPAAAGQRRTPVGVCADRTRAPAAI